MGRIVMGNALASSLPLPSVFVRHKDVDESKPAVKVQSSASQPLSPETLARVFDPRSPGANRSPVPAMIQKQPSITKEILSPIAPKDVDIPARTPLRLRNSAQAHIETWQNSSPQHNTSPIVVPNCA